jgi:hypothetical protein
LVLWHPSASAPAAQITSRTAAVTVMVSMLPV